MDKDPIFQHQSAVINNHKVEVRMRHSNLTDKEKKKNTAKGEKTVPSTEQMKVQGMLMSK